MASVSWWMPTRAYPANSSVGRHRQCPLRKQPARRPVRVDARSVRRRGRSVRPGGRPGRHPGGASPREDSPSIRRLVTPGETIAPPDATGWNAVATSAGGTLLRKEQQLLRTLRCGKDRRRNRGVRSGPHHRQARRSAQSGRARGSGPRVQSRVPRLVHAPRSGRRIRRDRRARPLPRHPHRRSARAREESSLPRAAASGTP